jgi:hypothetical protein
MDDQVQETQQSHLCHLRQAASAASRGEHYGEMYYCPPLMKRMGYEGNYFALECLYEELRFWKPMSPEEVDVAYKRMNEGVEKYGITFSRPTPPTEPREQ